MARRNFCRTSGIILDRCHEHGTWLDADELEALAGFILSGGRPQADAFMKDLDTSDQRQRLKVAAMKVEPAGRRKVWQDSKNETSGFVGLLFDLLS